MTSFLPRLLRRGSLICALGVLGSVSAVEMQATPACATPVPAVSPNLADYVVPQLDDFDTTMKATFFNERAARKINRDIGALYQLQGDVHIRYKEENKFRADGKLGGSSASYVVTDARQTFKLSIGLKKTDNLGNSPGKRKSLLDMGMISQGYLTFAQGQFLGEKVLDGVPCAVFKITYKNRGLDSSHRIVWIDPRTKITLKREEYAQDTNGGKLRSVWLYKGAHQVGPGIFFPSEIELYNAENEKAGATAYTNTRVNVGLNDSIFRL